MQHSKNATDYRGVTFGRRLPRCLTTYSCCQPSTTRPRNCRAVVNYRAMAHDLHVSVSWSQQTRLTVSGQ